jgi:Transposase DDE domain
LVTTILDAEVYSAEALADLYYGRWQVETNYKDLKITMEMDVLHCNTVGGVLKELAVFALAYNFVRSVMVKGAGAKCTRDPNQCSEHGEVADRRRGGKGRRRDRDQGESADVRPSGTARQETAPEAVSPNDRSSLGAAQTPFGAERCGLTSGHSAMSPSRACNADGNLDEAKRPAAVSVD